jgi:hypothetical protein
VLQQTSLMQIHCFINDYFHSCTNTGIIGWLDTTLYFELKIHLKVYLSQDISELSWLLQIHMLWQASRSTGREGKRQRKRRLAPRLPFPSSLHLLLWRSTGSQIFCDQYIWITVYMYLICYLHLDYGLLGRCAV